jgi:tetratricopeptide (TPR) repeat protein
MLNINYLIMKNIIKSTLVLALILIAQMGFGQTAKSYYKSAEAFMKSNQFEDVVTNCTKAMELDPQFISAYVLRAQAYEKTFKFELAAKDYELASSLDPKEISNFLKAAQLHYLLNNPKTSLNYADKAIEIDKKNIDAYDIKIKSLIAIDLIKEAAEMADISLDLKKTYQTLFNKGWVSFLQKDYPAAVDYFQKAISKDKTQIDAVIKLAESFFAQDNLNDALNTANDAVTMNEKSRDAYMIRAKIEHKKIEYQKAINDLSKVITLYPNDKDINDVYMLRGTYYFEFNQHMSAINDFTQIIESPKKMPEAYFKRASAYEFIHNYDAAKKDYETLKTVKLTSFDQEQLLVEAEKRLFELKREADKPEILIVTPKLRNKGEIEVLKGNQIVEIEAEIKDASTIKSLEINTNRVLVEAKNGKNTFIAQVKVTDKNEINITATDVYDNTVKENYKIIYTEVDAPQILLISPMASDDGQILMENSNPKVFIEGSISDESLIKMITINGTLASYVPDIQNPAFTASIDLTNQSKLTIIAEDIYGNKTTKEYLLNREGISLSEDNPMGKTWVIFIENSNYASFASLNGPSKDISVMKAALTNYKIHNIIVKRNMSKKEMERFFSIELRDLIQKNHVNSIVVWYAGHGKFVNNTGYWIPVDAVRDDEFTYFNISALKSSMQSYASSVVHTLVITDACESGPTFYQAMRATPKVRDCGDWTATKFKSSQVFSSAGYELASDNSQFTKTFATTLLSNPNQCIPIESIVMRVTDAVSKNKQQKPQFGKIDGLTDEDGTFFFIKK